LAGIFLNRLAFPLTIPIFRLFSAFLSSAHFPALWLHATVIPLYKCKGLRNDPSCYRPISLTPVISKLFERIIKAKLAAHLSLHKLLDEKQHGFVERKSVISNLLITDAFIAKSLDAHVPVDVVLFNFSKGFDRVPHTFLINRLVQVGVGGKLLHGSY
jgi:hypothetical protein